MDLIFCSNRQDDGVWKLTDAIPGEPDRDYPILSEIPETDFSCNGRHHGRFKLRSVIIIF